MPTSGSGDYNQTATGIINKAFFHIGKKMRGMSISPDDYDTALSLLNDLVKMWQSAPYNLHLWAKQEGVLYITPNVGEYTLGSYVYFTKKDDQVIQQLSSALIAGNTSVSVGDTSDMKIGDKIGIVLDDGSIHWSLILTIDSSTALTIYNSITGAAASSNLVYTFTHTAEKPLRVLNGRLIYGYDSGANSTQREIPMDIIPYQEYWNISATTLGGNYSNQCCYNPKVNSGTLYVWPRPNNGNYRVQLTYERKLEDLDSLDEDFDFPSEWYIPLQFGLAELLIAGYGCIPERAIWVRQKAIETLNALQEWDNELSYIQLAPNIQSYD
jgi:hypothetical protein